MKRNVHTSENTPMRLLYNEQRNLNKMFHNILYILPKRDSLKTLLPGKLNTIHK